MLAQYISQFKAEQAVEEIPEKLSYPSLVPCLRGGTAVLNAAGSGIQVQADPLGRTTAESLCREGIVATIGFLQRNVPGYENCYLIQYATQPLFLDVPQPLRLRVESAAVEDGLEAMEDIVVLEYCDPDNPDSSVAVPLGNLLCPSLGNMLLARSGSMASEQVPLLMACGGVAGRLAAQSVLYDGELAKLEIDRLKKALIY
jgi:hypothetical protein